jgi:hypothetical protein
MKGLESIKFSEAQLAELEKEASNRGISVQLLVERKMRKSLLRVSGRKLNSAEIIPFEGLKSDEE